MSTVVDNETPSLKRRRLSAAETQTRVLAAARGTFSNRGFDHVGLREIATKAGTDAAVIVRLFGSKEALFRRVVEGAFGLEAAFEGPCDTLGFAIAGFLLSPVTPDNVDDFDAFQFLLRSCTSPVAAPILSKGLHVAFVGPLAERLGGIGAQERAALLTACLLGFATMRFALESPFLQGTHLQALRPILGAALQACISQ